MSAEVMSAEAMRTEVVGAEAAALLRQAALTGAFPTGAHRSVVAHAKVRPLLVEVLDRVAALEALTASLVEAGGAMRDCLQTVVDGGHASAEAEDDALARWSVLTGEVGR